MTGAAIRIALPVAALIALAGCASSASSAKRAPRLNDAPSVPAEGARLPTPPAATAREEPPPSAPVRPFHFPAPTWAELKSGLEVATIVQQGAPRVEIRAVIPGGRAADGDRPGVAELTGELLLEGGAGALAGSALLAKMEALGGTLAVETTLDATLLRASAPRDALGPALNLIGQVLERPRLGPAALDDLKRRAIERVRALARDDARWAALITLHRELYLLRTERHPYSSSASTTAELAKITAADCRAFFQRHFTPGRTSLIVAGDVAPDAVRAAVEAAFTARARRDPEDPSLTDPIPPASLKITLVDRPGSADSEVYLGFLGPARGEREWVAFEIAGRLLASAAPLPVARGPVPMVAHAAAPAAKTGLAVQRLLDQAERLSTTGPEPEEVEAAAKQHLGALAARLDSPAALADELASLHLRALPDTHHDAARRELIDMPAMFVGKVAAAYLRPDHGVLVVAGDAEKVGPLLTRFGQVKVVDPIRDFERVRTLSANPEAPLELPAAP